MSPLHSPLLRGMFFDSAPEAQHNTCWISGAELGLGWAKEAVARVCVHEVGHVITVPEHPDKGGGLAPLEGTDRTRRLLFSGVVDLPSAGHLWVKPEWDKAEEWLIRVVDDFENQ